MLAKEMKKKRNTKKRKKKKAWKDRREKEGMNNSAPFISNKNKVFVLWW